MIDRWIDRYTFRHIIVSHHYHYHPHHYLLLESIDDLLLLLLDDGQLVADVLHCRDTAHTSLPFQVDLVADDASTGAVALMSTHHHNNHHHHHHHNNHHHRNHHHQDHHHVHHHLINIIIIITTYLPVNVFVGVDPSDSIVDLDEQHRKRAVWTHLLYQ